MKYQALPLLFVSFAMGKWFGHVQVLKAVFEIHF